jgi:hypothetical protein
MITDNPVDLTDNQVVGMVRLVVDLYRRRDVSDSGLPIFDLHQHVGALAILDEPGAEESEQVDEEVIADDCRRRVAALDQHGFSAAAVMPSLQYLRPDGIVDTRAINEMIAGYRELRPDRFPVSFGTVEPLHGVGRSVAEIDRIGGELNLDGVVWHHRFQGAFLDDSRMGPFLEALGRNGLPALVHLFADSAMESASQLENIATRNPEVTIIALDPFSGHNQAEEIMRVADRCPQVLFDTAVCFPLMRLIERFVARFGSERLLFGTDLYLDPPAYHTPHVLNEVLGAPDLTERDRHNILWGNAARLFGGGRNAAAARVFAAGTPA